MSIKKLFLFLLLISGISAAQVGVRWEAGSGGPGAGVTTVSTGNIPYLVALSGVTLNWCQYPANSGQGSKCTNFAPTFTDLTLTTSCPSGQPIVLQQSSVCRSNSDGRGNLGVYTFAGNYTYTLTSGSVTYGPFTVTVGGAGSGTGNVLTTGGMPGQFAQFNGTFSLGSIASVGSGLVALQTDTPLLGNTTVANLRFPGITGSVQCAQFDINGNLGGTASACGSGGGGSVAGLPKQFQFNNAGTLAGTAAQNQTTQMTYDPTTGKVNIPNLANARSTDSYSWSQPPGADLTIAGAKTIALAPCPLGIDVSNNVNAPYAVYIATTGTPEVAFVTGGTCTGGAASGTITLTTVNAHGAGYTVSSASDGIKEAINDAGSPNATVIVPPSIGISPTHIIRDTIYLNSNKMTLSMYGAHLSCQVRGPCIYVGDRSGATQFQKVLGGRLAAGVNVDGIQITNTAAAAGTYTITTNGAHPYVLGDYVYVEWYQANATQHALVKVTSVTPTTFNYVLGSATVSSTASFGWSTLEAAAIEDNGEGVVIRDFGLTSAGSPNKFSFGIVVDNDQSTTIDHISNEGSGAVLRCTSNFCGAMIYGRGDPGNASVIWVRNSEISLQCGGNGILGLSGNSLHVSDTVIQGFNQYGIQYPGGLQEALITNVYEEVGICTNPQYPGSLKGMAGVLGTGIAITGGGPIVGENPSYANTGVNQRNYFIVPKSVGFGTGPILYAGYATTNNAGTVNVYWPQIINDNAAGAITYDVLLTTSGVSPYLGNANSLATGISGSCSNGICTFADTHAATSAYTVTLQNWFPHIYFWPGSYVGTIAVNHDASIGVDPQFRLDKLETTSVSGYVSSYGIKIPSALVDICTTAQATWSPSWISCQNTQTSGSALFAQLYQQIGGSNTGPFAGSKGRLNFGQVAPNFPIHIQTLVDSTFLSKTLATVGNRPLADANDSYIGEDQSGGISYGAPTSLSHYIGNIGDNAAWLERLTSAGKTVKVPFTVNDGGTAFNMRTLFGACSSPGDASHDVLCADPSGDLAFNKKNEAIFEKVIPQNYTFSSGIGFPALPAANTVATTQLAIIVDASTNSCPVTSGGGSQKMLVRSNGATWDCVGGSGGSAISVGLYSTLPGLPSNNQLAVVTDWTGSCPVTSGSGALSHSRLVKFNSGTSLWDCVPDGLLPFLTTVQPWDGAGNGGIHFSASSTDTNASDQNSLHTNSLGTLLIFADSTGPPASLYTLGMWPAASSLPTIGAQKCLSVDSSGHIIFSTFACYLSPITTQGDIIVGNGSGVGARLGIGANGTAPVSNGTTVSYQAVLTNPMTTPEDTIKGGTAGAPVRVPIGSNGQVWQVVGGVAQWGAVAGGGTVNSGTACNPAYYATSTAAVSGFTNICLGDGSATAWMKINPATASQDLFNVSLNSVNKFWVDSTGIVHVTSAGVQAASNTVYGGATAGSNVDYSASIDSNVNQTGTSTFRNGDVTGNSSSSAGPTVVRGGNIIGTGATASAADVTVQPGALINAAPGASATEGRTHILNAYLKGGTTTTGNLACVVSTNTVGDCILANNARAVGVIHSTNGGTVYVQKIGRFATVNLDASSTFSANDRFCTSTTVAGQIHANGSAQCPSSTAIAGFAAASGTSVSTVDLDIGSSAGGCSDCVVITGTSDLTGRTTSEGAVTLALAPTAGLYTLKYYADLNTACTTGGNTVSFTFSWTDATGARTLSTGSLSLAQNAPVGSSYLTGVIPLWVGSGNVTFTSTISGTCASGTSSYDRHMSLVKG